MQEAEKETFHILFPMIFNSFYNVLGNLSKTTAVIQKLEDASDQ